MSTPILSLLHLTVDGLCACCVFMWTPLQGATWAFPLFIVYNVLAFMTQPIAGLWVDGRTEGSRTVFYSSLALLICGAVLTGILSPTGNWVAAFASIGAIGLGNALFHVYGGKQVALRTHNDIRHLGIFVSTGAIGLIVGQALPYLPVLMGIVAILLLLSWALIRQQNHSHTPLPLIRDRILQQHHGKGMYLLLFMILIVFVRSFVSQLTSTGNMDTFLYASLLAVLAFTGKSMGGFVASRFGAMQALTCTLLLSGFFLLVNLLCPAVSSVASLVMVLCVNLTMPITLYLANRQLQGREGLAFGLLAAVLFPGYLLGVCLEGELWTQSLLIALVATMVIEALVLIGIRERRWQVLGMSMFMNILTNLPLNLLVLALPFLYTSMLAQIGLECIVVVVEALLYFLVMRDVRKAFSYALLCNSVSYLAGLLWNLLS